MRNATNYQKDIIQQYLAGLESGNIESIVSLFSDDAIVHSPLYGDMPAKDFFKSLVADTTRSDISLINIFSSIDQPDTCAAHFRYHWTLKGGTATSFECVDVFQLNELGKIKVLTIIYDTHKTRELFDRLK